MKEDSTEQSIALLPKVIAAMDTAAKTLHDAALNIQSNAVALAEVRISLKSMEESIKALTRVVMDNNGKSLIVRMALVESELSDVEEWKKETEASASYRSMETSRYQWSIKLAILSGIISFLSSAVVLTITLAAR